MLMHVHITLIVDLLYNPWRLFSAIIDIHFFPANFWSIPQFTHKSHREKCLTQAQVTQLPKKKKELDFLSPAYFFSSSKIPGGYLLIYVILIVVLEHL